MLAPDRDDDALLAMLERERGHFLAELARVPLPLQTQRVLPACWSALEVVEHVSRVDASVVRMFGAARGGMLPTASGSVAIGAPLPSSVVAQLRDRGARLAAPERVRPTGTLTPEAALVALEEARASLIATYRAAPTDLLDGTAYPHPYLGPLTLRAWMEMSAHHDARHAQQLAELASMATAAGGQSR